MNVHQVTHPVGTLCRLLQVSRSGFYAWQDRPMSKRERQDLVLKGKIEAVHRHSHEAYGSPRVHLQLRAEGVYVSRKRVERLMREMQLRGACRRKFITTTQRDPNARPAPDLVNRQFTASAPNELWVADATYIPTWVGFLYLAIVLDVYSRRIVGWALENHLRTDLMLDALNRAYAQRLPHEVIHHSDHDLSLESIALHDARIILGQAVRGAAQQNQPAGHCGRFPVVFHEVGYPANHFVTQGLRQRPSPHRSQNSVGPSGRSEHDLRGPGGLKGCVQRDRSTG